MPKPSAFGKGIDDGKKYSKWIVAIFIAAFVLWFLYEGLNVIIGFDGFSW